MNSWYRDSDELGPDYQGRVLCPADPDLRQRFDRQVIGSGKAGEWRIVFLSRRDAVPVAVATATRRAGMSLRGLAEEVLERLIYEVSDPAPDQPPAGLDLSGCSAIDNQVDSFRLAVELKSRVDAPIALVGIQCPEGFAWAAANERTMYAVAVLGSDAQATALDLLVV